MNPPGKNSGLWDGLAIRPNGWRGAGFRRSLLAGLFSLTALAAAAQEPPLTVRQQEPIVAARVDGEPIFVHEVERELAGFLKDLPIEPDALKRLQAQTLQQLVDRRLVLRYLARQQLGASQQEIDLAVDRIQRGLRQHDLSFAEHLQRSGLDEAELRRRLAWQLSWRRYLDRYLTDENLERYFHQHRRQYDGAQVQAAHILLLLKPQSSDDGPALSEALARAQQIRARILAGELTFSEAAQAYSDAPTAPDGGQLGFISRHEPMPESFSRAAFALVPDEISQPVVSPFGVHLIHCQQIKPGQKTWQDVRGQLESDVARHLFQWAADRERPRAAIEFTGALPYFRPGAKELADGA